MYTSIIQIAYAGLVPAFSFALTSKTDVTEPADDADGTGGAGVDGSIVGGH